MNEIKKNFLEFLNNKLYIASIILVSTLSFCFLLTHSTVNIDTLSFDRYFSGTELFAQKRFAAPILERIFHIFNYNPFFVDFVAILLLIVSSILFCSFIKKISSNKIKNTSYIIFSCLFISYSLLPEIFTYTPMGLCIALGYILTYLSIILVYDYFKNRNIKNLIFSSILLTFAISLYESFASVYILGVFITFIIESIYNTKSFKALFKKGLLYCLILIMGIVLNTVISNLILIIFNIKQSVHSDKLITYSTGIINGIKTLIKTSYNNYFSNGLFYLPITTFVISVLINIVMIFKNLIKKNTTYIWILGTIVATISLSIIKGIAAPYRTCQTFALFIAFTFLIFSNYILAFKTKKILKNIFIITIFTLIFYQCYDMHNWFYTNYLRSEEEKNTLIYIGNRLENEFDISKPIVIIGNYKLSKNITNRISMNSKTYRYKIYNKIYAKNIYTPFNNKIGETNVNSYIFWGMGAFDGTDTEINKWWKLLGYNFRTGTNEMKNEAESYLSKCTKKSCIYETEKYIIVVFSTNNVEL